MRARLALFIDKIIVFVVLIAAFPDLAFAQLRIIPENDLIRIQRNYFLKSLVLQFRKQIGRDGGIIS